MTVQTRVATTDLKFHATAALSAAASNACALDLRGRAERAAATAAAHADAVDRDARFPEEAMAALRAERLLGILVPTDLGGDGATVSDVVDVCYMLGRSCGSTAMVYAMHQIMVALLVRHARTSAWHSRLLRRLSAEQMLLASSTTDGQGGGDLRTSTAAVEPDGARIAVEKSATVMSYGAQADGIVTTARRAPDAPGSDQVLVAFAKRDYFLERRSEWDTLGMRGTCSAGFLLKAAGERDQVLPLPYQLMHARTMMPVAHLTWSAVWAGIAAASVERARLFVRNAARRAGGQLPPGAAHFTRAGGSLGMLRALVAMNLQRFEALSPDAAELEALDFQAALNLLKVNASELAIATVMSALQACGLSGYRNDGDFSVSRHLRDALSSSVMINNDRILTNVASASLLTETPSLLRG
jgi:acyl-CoA dehydrogenase